MSGPGTTLAEQQIESALLAIFALRLAKDEATNGLTANAKFIDQHVAVALGELERAFLPAEGTPVLDSGTRTTPTPQAARRAVRDLRAENARLREALRRADEKLATYQPEAWAGIRTARAIIAEVLGV